MSDLLKKSLNLSTLDAMKVLEMSHPTSQAMREMASLSSAAKFPQVWMMENGAIAEAQRFLKDNAISTSIAAMEYKHAEDLKRLVNPYYDIQNMRQQEVGIQAAVESARQLADQSNKFSLDLQKARAFCINLDHYRGISKQFEASFRMPNLREAATLLASTNVESGTAADYVRRFVKNISSQQDLFKSMSHPWIQGIETQRSAAALMELHGLGSMLRTVDGFDDAIASALRSGLGDWRDSISFPEPVFDDPVARTEFYVERGFNPALTNFPDNAFQESLVLVGLDSDPCELIQWPELMHAVDSIEDAAFQRTNKCHNYLQRLELRLRQFIDREMTAQYGENWPKIRLAEKVLEAWEYKKSRAENSGVILTMYIDVADFTDYEAIICNKEHWRLVFEARFKRKESVRESLQRLYPIRLATMHARFVTREDVLYLLAESSRLLRAISG